MQLSKSKIVIDWAYKPPTKREMRSVQWTGADLAGLSESSWDVICAKLFGNGLVGRVLKNAFERGLARDLTWVGSDLSSLQSAALIQAAKIFKRGVPCELPGQPETSGLPATGQSAIEFFEVLTELFARLAPGDVLLIDAHVYDLWKGDLPEGAIPVAVSEAQKDLAAVARIADAIPPNAKRVVIIGGGVLGDIAGFACGLRNLATVYVPTTLLAMADSSVGGKTGVNADIWGKNQIGLFHVPLEVWIWSGWLRTLSERSLKSGLVECVKHALLSCDLELWNGLIELAKKRQWSEISRYLLKVVMFKAIVVEADPREQGERAILNLGHTMGHAVEFLSLKVDGKDALTHGEAVAIGLCHALRLSKEHAGLQHADQYIQQLKDCGLVPPLSETFMKHADELAAYLKTDKKNKDATVRWVLLRKFGEVARTSDGEWTIPLSDPNSVVLSFNRE